MEYPLDMFQLDFIEYVGMNFLWICSKPIWDSLSCKENVATLSLYIFHEKLSTHYHHIMAVV